ncbi:MAG: hypothetical protein AW07_04726 [Candidatus Accumulibacter sp. SK-11]|nr:MAG: hypothetical protein AW07_04726 [Candidatus Accumulibacter sp. SK-11]
MRIVGRVSIFRSVSGHQQAAGARRLQRGEQPMPFCYTRGMITAAFS